MVGRVCPVWMLQRCWDLAVDPTEIAQVGRCMALLEDLGELEGHTFGQFRDIICKAAHDTGLRRGLGCVPA